jgi:hypothetical protein
MVGQLWSWTPIERPPVSRHAGAGPWVRLRVAARRQRLAFHHKAATPMEAVNELVATPEAVPASRSAYRDRNTLLIDSAQVGDGGLGAAPGRGHHRADPARVSRSPASGACRSRAQRVTYNVPASGGAVLLKLDPGVYTSRTALLNVEWHSAAAAGG